MGVGGCIIKGGTTSACAENTFSEEHAPEPFWNYLRVRGEYQRNIRLTTSFRELPPRARRILTHFLIHCQAHGTTSACAENTCQPSGGRVSPGNYLRVRGEYPAA